MDYYSDEGGKWSNYFKKNQEAKLRKEQKGLLKKKIKIGYENDQEQK